MSKTVKVQRIDGETRITLPKGVTAKDFEKWLNNAIDSRS